ncbi:hypothetical protein N9235_03595 [Gammaproteobacteria bacterium]|nr:hypothetical protein [Gammaproteobacteria bacterium]
MNEAISRDDNPVEDMVARLNEAYSNRHLDEYRALELKDSFTEETTCAIQWGPMMRT